MFTIALSVATLGIALIFAFAAHHVLRGQSVYKTFLLIPYAIAPAISGIVWPLCSTRLLDPSPI